MSNAISLSKTPNRSGLERYSKQGGYGHIQAELLNRSDPNRVYSSGFESQTSGPEAPGARGCVIGYDRRFAPEMLLTDGQGTDPYIIDKIRALPPYNATAPGDMVSLVSADYSQVGSVGQSRAAMETMFSGFSQNVQRFPFVTVGTDSTVIFNSTTQVAPSSIGLRIDWGVNLLNFAPFDLQVVTENFVQAFGLQSVDRNITLRVNSVSGCSLYFLWALRQSPSMSIAQNQIGDQHVTDVLIPSITIPGLPANVLANFSATLQFLTAFSPITDAWATGVGLYRGVDVG